MGAWAPLGAWTAAWKPHPGAWFEPCPWTGLAESETVGDVGRSTCPRLGVSDAGKSIDLVAVALRDLGLDLSAL